MSINTNGDYLNSDYIHALAQSLTYEITHPSMEITNHIRKCQFTKFAHAVRCSAGDDIVIWLRLLQHQVHCAHVILRVAPVASSIQVPETEF